MSKRSQASLEHFSQVEVSKPSDVILAQIRSLIREGKLRPGDVLPSERALAERFGVGRAQVREGLKRLEFYGILRTEPNKGTVVAGLGAKTLEGIISSVVQLDRNDAQSLFETRAILETASARLAAARITPDLLKEVRTAHTRFRDEVNNGRRALEEDHVFHLKIGEATGNSILSSFVGLLTPDVIQMNRNVEEPDPGYRKQTLSEHERVMEALEAGNAEEAASAMERHMELAYARRFGQETADSGKSTKRNKDSVDES